MAESEAWREDQVVAEEFWHGHLLRNQSVVVDLLVGQLKSSLIMFDCGRISVTFDPYSVLSLPVLPDRLKHLQVMVVFHV